MLLGKLDYLFHAFNRFGFAYYMFVWVHTIIVLKIISILFFAHSYRVWGGVAPPLGAVKSTKVDLLNTSKIDMDFIHLLPFI